MNPESESRSRKRTTVRVTLGLLSAGGGFANAVAVRHAGRSITAAVVAGGSMAVFVWWGTRRVRSFFGRTDMHDATDAERDPTGSPPLRSWANPSRSQRLAARWRATPWSSRTMRPRRFRR